LDRVILCPGIISVPDASPSEWRRRLEQKREEMQTLS